MIQKQTGKYDSVKKSLGVLDSVSCESLDANDQKIIKKYVQANSQSCALLKTGLLKQALEILEISEQSFRKMTENGQKINEVLLTATMHNISAAHQRLGNINKSLDYVRTLIYNLNNRILKVQKQNSFESNLFSFNMDVNIAKCYIYFLSLTIQLKMLEAAVVPANRVLQFFKKFCKDYHKSELSLQLINTKMTQKLFFQIQQFQSLRLNTTQWELMENLKQAVAKVKNIPSTPSLELSKLKKFSIANLTKINELQIYIKDNKIVQKYPGNKSFENGLIEFPLCLFLIGKSLHESNSSKGKKQEASIRIAMVDKTKQYFLWSLYFVCELCPYFTPLHKEFFDYFQFNFKNQQTENTNEAKKLQCIDSLQTPSLKDSSVWKDIKRKRFELQNVKSVTNQTKQQQTPILNQKAFLKSLQLEKIKVKNKEKTQKLVDKKRFNRHSSQQVFNTQRKLFHEKLKSKSRSNKKQLTSDSKLNANIISKQQTPIKKQKKNEPKRNLSLKSISLPRGTIKFVDKPKKIHTQKKFDEFLEEYFPKFPESKKNEKNRERFTFKVQEKRKFLADYSNLQKKIRSTTKSLSVSKKNMFKSPKKR